MNDELRAKLLELGVTPDAMNTLDSQEVMSEEDLKAFSYDQLVAMGVKAGSARKIADAFAPVVAPPEPTAEGHTEAEIPEGQQPSASQLNAAAAQFGIDSNMLMMMAMGGGGLGGLNLSDMIEPARVVPSYRPRIRNFSYIILDQLQASLGGEPIIVIDDNGSVNADLTAKYILELQEGNEPAEDNIYYDQESTPHEVIKVGVDMQSIYDADPVDPTRTLQISSGMGRGRINWTGVALDVRQLIWYAATVTRELNPADEALMGRLRDKIKPGVTRSVVRIDFPKANAAWNEGNRVGSLPTLKKQMTTRAARRPALATPRRAGTQRDLSDYREPAFVRGDDQNNR